MEPIGITIVTNKVVLLSDLQAIENYIKNIENINLEDIEALRLSQSKTYLKIIGIPYFMENTNVSITLDFVESVIKANHIFNNLSLISKSHVIKTLPNSDIVIVWLDIWDAQSEQKTKNLINRYFNIRRYITTIYGTNMNLSISQCKNCWKWGYTTFVSHTQGSKCVKCNSPHKSEYY